MNFLALYLCGAAALLFQAPATISTANTYTLGAGDQIVIRVPDLEEIDNKTIPIDQEGTIDLPKVGRLKASGLNTEQLAAAIADKLRKYLVNPDVAVYLNEMKSQPVSVLGEVQTPGVHQLQGRKTLFEVLSLAGGLRSEAGNVINITRGIEWGIIPLPNVKTDSTGQFTVASVDVKSVMSASNPAENIIIKPNDVISVPKAETIYVIGAVKKPGAYVLGQYRSLSAMQILALAEGTDKTADTKGAKIMRLLPNSDQRSEIPVDLKTILDGKVPDVALKGDDILFVPVSKAKVIGYRTIEAMAQGATLLVYRVP